MLKSIQLSEIFDISYGHSLELNSLKPLPAESGGVAFVSRRSGGNGISAYVAPIDNLAPSPKGILTCALGGSVLRTYLQEQPFYSGRDMALLAPRVALSKAQMLFYCYVIFENRFRYSYGRQANRTLKSILVPVPDDASEFAGELSLDMYRGATAPFHSVEVPMDSAKWRSFKIGELFEIRKGQRLTKADMSFGTTVFVGASDRNNGVTNVVGQSALHSSGTISVTYNGSVAEAFFQPHPYWASDDVNVLYPRGFELSALSALFICTVIRAEKYRFSYGRKWHVDRMKESVIRLPVLATGSPDWLYMESFIESLPYSGVVRQSAM